MDWVTQNKLIKWLIGILLVANILTISIIWMLTLGNQSASQQQAKEINKPSESAGLLERELNLTIEQTKQYEILRQQHLKRSKSLDEKKTDLKIKIAEEVFKAKPDTILIDSLTKQIGLLEVGLEKLRFIHFKDFVSIISPEQREKFKPVLLAVYDKRPPRDELKNDKRKEPEKIREENIPRKKTDVPEGEYSKDRKLEPPSPEEKISKYSERLNLTQEQVNKLVKILEESKKRNRDLKNSYPSDSWEFLSEKEKTREEEDMKILNILDEDQKREFEKMIEKRKK